MVVQEKFRRRGCAYSNPGRRLVGGGGSFWVEKGAGGLPFLTSWVGSDPRPFRPIGGLRGLALAMLREYVKAVAAVPGGARDGIRTEKAAQCHVNNNFPFRC